MRIFNFIVNCLYDMTGGSDKEFRIDRTVLLIHTAIVCFTASVITFFAGIVISSIDPRPEKDMWSTFIAFGILAILYWVLHKYGPSNSYVRGVVGNHDNRNVGRILIGCLVVTLSIFSILFVGLFLEKFFFS
jgi:hypothetical protein